MTDPIRVMIVADHPIMSEGLRLTFQREKDIELVCEVQKVRLLLKEFRRGNPNVAVVDLQLSRAEGLRAVRTLRAVASRLPIVVLTTYQGEAEAIARDLGNLVEICKTVSSDAIVAAVRSAALRSVGRSPPTEA
jgi:DNA-binding NarL/FixJ family response regulator